MVVISVVVPMPRRRNEITTNIRPTITQPSTRVVCVTVIIALPLVANCRSVAFAKTALNSSA